jgi:hypothetical protein
MAAGGGERHGFLPAKEINFARRAPTFAPPFRVEASGLLLLWSARLWRVCVYALPGIAPI